MQAEHGQIEPTRPLISIAPMLDITNIYFRNFIRLITSEATLYTQMIHHNAITMNEKDRLSILRYDQVEHPVVIQLGGSEPSMIAESAKIAAALGYDQINLNVGCPSHRVQYNQFGACLMKKPELVGELMKVMSAAVSLPCTVKCRLGVDNLDSYEFCRDFIKTVSVNGHVQHFIIHARKAFLKGLNPAENRNIPPLNYDYVYQLQKEFPELRFSLNGGIRTISQAKSLIQEKGLYGCMIGRGAYDDPWEMRHIDSQIYSKPSKNHSKEEVLYQYSDFVERMQEYNKGAPLPLKLKPIVNLLCGVRNNAKYRQYLSQTNELSKMESFGEIIHQAIKVANEHCKGQMERRKNDY